MHPISPSSRITPTIASPGRSRLARRGGSLRSAVLLLCAAVFAHCGGPLPAAEEESTAAQEAPLGTPAGDEDQDVYAGTVRSIAVSPAAPSVAKGATLQFTVIATYTDGTTSDVTKMATWAVKDLSGSGVATIDTTGLLTAKTVGRASISARFKTRSASATVTVTPPALSSITISPADPTIPKGGSIRFAATGVFSDGSSSDITRDVSWEVTDLMGSRVASIDGTGTANGVSAGTATVSAEYMGLTAETTLTVGVALPASLSISPASALIAKGTSQVYKATLTLTDGSTQDATSMATWTASDRMGTGIATISSTGVAKGNAVGSSTITATYMGHSAAALLTVTPAVLIAVGVSPATLTLSKGGFGTINAIGTYSDGTSASVTTAGTWTVSDVMGVDVVSIDSPGRVLGKNVGKAKVTVTLSGFRAETLVDVVLPTYTKLTITGVPITIQGLPTPFTATATLSDGSTQDVTARCRWTVKDIFGTGVATIDSAGVLTGKTTGQVEVGASFMGLSASYALFVF